jgi:hypothetical protein
MGDDRTIHGLVKRVCTARDDDSDFGNGLDQQHADLSTSIDLYGLNHSVDAQSSFRAWGQHFCGIGRCPRLPALSSNPLGQPEARNTEK